jgi:hypothetical protein
MKRSDERIIQQTRNYGYHSDILERLLNCVEPLIVEMENSRQTMELAKKGFRRMSSTLSTNFRFDSNETDETARLECIQFMVI